MARPSYAELSAKYSEDVHACPDISTSPNQCAVRLSRALIGVGIKMDSAYPADAKLCRHGFARGAQDLGRFLRKKWEKLEYGFERPTGVPAAAEGKKGVVLFIELSNFDGQGHIDLWDGTKPITGKNEYWKRSKTVWLWLLPHNLAAADRAGPETGDLPDEPAGPAGDGAGRPWQAR